MKVIKTKTSPLIFEEEFCSICRNLINGTNCSSLCWAERERKESAILYGEEEAPKYYNKDFDEDY